MTLPQAKRRRHLILSDDDEPSVTSRHSPAGPSSRSKTTLPERKLVKSRSDPKRLKVKAVVTDSPNPSPKKGSARGARKVTGVKSLHTFFGRATEEQRWTRDEKTLKEPAEDDDVEDTIEDDCLDEALFELEDRLEVKHKVLDRRKISQTIDSLETARAPQSSISSSQRFAKQPKPAEGQRISAIESGDNRVWADRFAPTSLAELAVHKRKVADVQNWLASVLQGRDRRVCEPSLHPLRASLC
jgi:cell cycle checkpoint protein